MKIVEQVIRRRRPFARAEPGPMPRPSTGSPAQWFIGISTDPVYVSPSCTMLSSLDDNGDVPEAIVMVADFGLDEEDRQALRAAAGRLGPGMVFVPLSSDSPKIVARPAFPLALPLLGRFVLPAEIDVPGARLLLVDSDMIVNRSLRPLFETDMRGHPLAAVHNFSFPDDYLNAGLLLIDLDIFNERQLGAQAMKRLAAYPERPKFLDQDALNDLLAGDWLHLDQSWNFFHTNQVPSYTLTDFEGSAIAHFAGPKPWEWYDIAGRPLYERHARLAQVKQPWLLADPGDLACDRPALTSSLSRYSRSRDPGAEAMGANSSLVPATYGFHTDEEHDPWWRVNLECEALVLSVLIVNRPSEAHRFRCFSIETSFDDETWTTRYEKTDDSQVSSRVREPWRIDFDHPVAARFVRIRCHGLQCLHLRRVQVLGWARSGIEAEWPGPHAEGEVVERKLAPSSVRTACDFLMTCYEVFLGRELEDLVVAEERSTLSLRDILRSVVGSEEFQINVGLALREAKPLPVHIFAQPPSVRQRAWAAGLPGLSSATAERARAARQWRALLEALFTDSGFAAFSGVQLQAIQDRTE